MGLQGAWEQGRRWYGSHSPFAFSSCTPNTAGTRTPTCPTAWCRPGSWHSSSGEQLQGVPLQVPRTCVVTPAPGACTAESSHLHQSQAEEHWAGPGHCSLVPGRAGKDSHPCPHRHTSKAADVVLLGGDLNMHPEDVGTRLLRGWTGLRDAFVEAARFEVS